MSPPWIVLVSDPDSRWARRLALSDYAERIAGVGCWEWTLESDEILWSPNLFRIFGLEPDSVAATPPFVVSRVHPDDRGRIEELLRTLRTDGPTDRGVEYRIVHDDGTSERCASRWRSLRTSGERSATAGGTDPGCDAGTASGPAAGGARGSHAGAGRVDLARERRQRPLGRAGERPRASVRRLLGAGWIVACGHGGLAPALRGSGVGRGDDARLAPRAWLRNGRPGLHRRGGRSSSRTPLRAARRPARPPSAMLR